MKIITFECPEGTKRFTFTTLLGKLWLDYLISQGEYTPDASEQFRLTEEEVLLYGQLMGEIAKSEGKEPN
jgi:hypothetical protein